MENNRGPLYKFLDGVVIKDSGERKEFETGAVRDMARGKGRMDLLPWEAIMEVSKHCEDGALKYGEHNVDKGIPVHSFVDSAFRHLAKYTAGYSDEPHLRAACWNLLWALQMTKHNKEMCDVPWVFRDGAPAKCRNCSKAAYEGDDVYKCLAADSGFETVSGNDGCGDFC